MEKWILIVGCDKKYYKRIKEECINYSVSVHIAVELGDAPDPEVTPIVREIFQWRADGIGSP